jgi:hypothetical protein
MCAILEPEKYSAFVWRPEEWGSSTGIILKKLTRRTLYQTFGSGPLQGFARQVFFCRHLLTLRKLNFSIPCCALTVRFDLKMIGYKDLKPLKEAF